MTVLHSGVDGYPTFPVGLTIGRHTVDDGLDPLPSWLIDWINEQDGQSQEFRMLPLGHPDPLYNADVALYKEALEWERVGKEASQDISAHQGSFSSQTSSPEVDRLPAPAPSVAATGPASSSTASAASDRDLAMTDTNEQETQDDEEEPEHELEDIGDPGTPSPVKKRVVEDTP